MAEARFSQDEFLVSGVFWILLKDPVTIHLDTVTVRAVLQTAGIRRMRRESTAALSADRPSVQDLF